MHGRKTAGGPGGQTHRQPGLRAQAVVAAQGRGSVSPSINTVSRTEFSVTSELATLLACYPNLKAFFSEPQHPTVHQEQGPWSQAQELILGQTWM